MKLRFVVDAQLSPFLAKQLQASGHLAEHVNRLRLQSSFDEDIWAYVERQRAVLISKDEDFVPLARRSASGAALMWIRLGNTRNRVLWDAVSHALPDVILAVEAGERVIAIE